jgi:hypothetical protein
MGVRLFLYGLFLDHVEDCVADLVVLKHKYWYMNIPNYGIMATPVQLYTPEDLRLARVLNGFVTGNSNVLYLLDPFAHPLTSFSRSLAPGRAQC